MEFLNSIKDRMPEYAAKLARFVSFVNAPDEADPTIAFDDSGPRRVPLTLGMPAVRQS